MREWLHGIVTSASFNALVTLVVLFNTIVMALKYYGIEDDPPMYKPCTRPHPCVLMRLQMECTLLILPPLACHMAGTSFTRP